MTDARAVLFDLDGTLVDTAPDMGGALNDMLVTRQYPPLPAAELRRLVSHGSRALIEHGFGDDNEAATTRRIREFLEVYGQRVARESALFEHMDALLRSLESRGIPWGVVTNKPEGLSIALMDALTLRERSCVLIGGDTLSERKPHPLPLLHAAKLINVPANHCLYVGDALRDIRAGRSAGMTTIAAAYGYILEDDSAANWGADYLVNSIADLATLIDGLLPAAQRATDGHH